MTTKRHLSKSKLISGWQCPKRLWLETYKRELIEISPQTQALFDLGHEVGAAAQTLWPDGILIEHDFELNQALQETETYLDSTDPVSIFEATIRHDGILIRADVLERDEDGVTRLIEVKASTSVKDYHELDCAIQYWVLDQAGITPGSVHLAHINSQFVYQGNGNYQGLFHLEDLTAVAQQLQPQVPKLAHDLRETLAGEEPAIDVGPQCTHPFDCPLIHYCNPQVTAYPVEKLGGSKQVIATLKADGIDDIRDIPAGRLTSSTQEWVRRVTADGEPELKPGAGDALNALPYPRYYLDFETVSFAVPIWKDTSPYKAYPFQWSIHVEQGDGELSHHEYLADGAGPPMRECMERMIEALGDSGPIMVYTGYERSVINRMARSYPDLRRSLHEIMDRLFDLHPLTKANYYHPDMQASWSLKKVLPTIAPDLDYESVGEIAEGSAADSAFRQLANGDLSSARRWEIRKALLDYCRLDTLAMARLAAFLANGDNPRD